MKKLISTLHFVINIIQIEDKKFVFTKESKETCRGQWSLPGGMREANESIFQASIREVQEEAGILVQPMGILKIEHLRYEGKDLAQPFEKLRYIVMAKYISGSLKTVEDSESQCAAAFSFNELSNLNLREPACIDWIRLAETQKELLFDPCYQFNLFK